MQKLLKEFIACESGQAITEYGGIIAFVAMLVTLCLAFAKGTLASTVSQTFSTMADQLNRLDSYTST